MAKKASKLKIVFLGGVGEIGKNMTCFEYQDTIIVIDAGLAFPKDQILGIDYVIPDYKYLVENKDKVKGFLLTHGHEDHLGALPTVLKDVNAPVFGSKLSLALLEHKLRENNVKNADLRPVEHLDKVTLGAFKVEFLRMTHSIAGALALCLDTPIGKVFHTGDFKIDHTPIDKRTVDLSRIADIGREGVQLLMMDSTNVERSGYSMSESKVYRAMENLFEQHSTKRIIVATFASNIHRVQQIINCAIKHGRRVALSGRSMENIAEIAYTLGELRYPQEAIISLDKISGIPDDKLCIISTGTQGEPMSALTRMSNNSFKKVVIGENDTVILSASSIPGNERMIYDVINNLSKRGAQVVYKTLEDIHVSGHACKEELRLMFALLKPKYFIPVHGEYRMQMEHVALAKEMGVPTANTVIPELGMVVYVAKNGMFAGETMNVGTIFVDGDSIPDEASEVLHERRHLACDGLVVAIVTTKDFDENPPIILTKGVRLSDEALKKIKDFILTELVTYEAEHTATSFKKVIWKYIDRIMDKQMHKRPVVMPVIIDN